MTAEMPRTNPNIMITARLLLIPVLSSVELKACAKAGMLLRVRMAAATRSERSRERTLGLICLMNFIRVCAYFSVVSGFSAEHAMTIPQTREVLVYVQHNIHAQSVLEPRDEQKHRPDDAHQTP